MIAPHDPYVQNLARRSVPPVWYARGDWSHPFGTDGLGRDYLSRTIYGARVSLLIGVSVAALSGLIGTVLGVAAGFLGGRVDLLVTFLITVRLALPVILVALASVAILGGSLPLVILVLGLLKWDRFVVVMRSATQGVRSLDFVAAARASGASRLRVIWREVMPNVLPFLIVTATLEAASAILLEAALSFLGLGVQPPLPSWGLMIAEAKPYMFFSFWLIAIPGICLAVLILAVNLLGRWPARRPLARKPHQLMTTRAAAIQHAEAHFDTGAFRADLSRRVAIPTESQNPARAHDLSRYLTDEMIPMLTGMGFACRLLEEPRAKGPFLFAERIEDPGAVTVFGYGHGDVIRGLDDQWDPGLSPWTVTDRNGRWYGRGVRRQQGPARDQPGGAEIRFLRRGASSASTPSG